MVTAITHSHQDLPYNDGIIVSSDEEKQVPAEDDHSCIADTHLSLTINERPINEQKDSEQEQTIQQARLGNEQAFGMIVDQYSTLMLKTASIILGDHDSAEDAVQDALILAWHHLGDLRQAGALRPWLIRIVVNQCISFKRRLARTTAFMKQILSEQEIDLIAQAADDQKGRIERRWDLIEAIESLPGKQKTVIILHYYNSMTLPEMAQALGISENTLKKRIQAALTNLRLLLHTMHIDEDYTQNAKSLNTNNTEDLIQQ